jgi:hypothetical protein
MIFLIVIDEAHTEVTWQGFRQAFLGFAEVPSCLQNIFGRERPPPLMLEPNLLRQVQLHLLQISTLVT